MESTEIINNCIELNGAKSIVHHCENNRGDVMTFYKVTDRQIKYAENKGVRIVNKVLDIIDCIKE